MSASFLGFEWSFDDLQDGIPNGVPTALRDWWMGLSHEENLLELRKLFNPPIFERWGKQFCLN